MTLYTPINIGSEMLFELMYTFSSPCTIDIKYLLKKILLSHSLQEKCQIETKNLSPFIKISSLYRDGDGSKMKNIMCL